MKKFQFSLKALLSYREHQEQIAMQELAKSQSDVNQVTAYIEELEHEFEAGRKNLEYQSELGITSEELRRYIDYLNGLEQRKEEARDVLARLRIIVEKRRATLHTRSVERKVITNLKDKRKREYVEEALKSAQKDSDEMVLLKGLMDKARQWEEENGK